MVAMKKRFYGKGPERARSYIVDDYVFCAMEGGLTRSEEILVEAGQEQAVRQYRLLFQRAMTDVTEAVEQITGRGVLGYHSQITFDPTRTFEIFVLGEPKDARRRSDRSRTGPCAAARGAHQHHGIPETTALRFPN